jgi:hypothetical protein
VALPTGLVLQLVDILSRAAADAAPPFQIAVIRGHMTQAEVTLLLLLTAFQIKHLLADFFWQTEAMLRTKGIWGHPVGATHSAIHAGLSAAILLLLAPIGIGWVALVLVAEFLTHYHTDWAKDQLNKRFTYTPRQKAYWVLVGLDQCAHQLTYVAILVLVAALT